MPDVTLRALARTMGPEAVYARVSDFARYPDWTDCVQDVRIRPPEPDGSAVSDWTVAFRGGLMRWQERDTFSPATHTIAFEQLSGDFETFEGSWSCAARGADTLVTFAARFDMGIPSLAEIIDPVAERTLRSNIAFILQGVLGAEVLDDDRAVAAPR